MNQLLAFLGIGLTDTTQQQKLQNILVAADAACKKYCKRSFETAVYTHYPYRLGGMDIVLPETPVLSYNITGTLTNGSPTVTGLPSTGTQSTASLIVGMPVLVNSTNTNNQNALPNNTTISAVGTTTVTLSANATANYTGSLIFGLAVWMDFGGSYGDGLGTNGAAPFASTTQLYPGQAFALVRDQSDGTSKSGILRRLGGFYGGSGAASLGAFLSGYGGYAGPSGGRNTLSASLPPLWPAWPPGSLKVVYAAGLGTGAVAPSGALPSTTTIPTDLTLAVNGLAAWMWNNSQSGLLQITSESFEGYSSSIESAMKNDKAPAALGSVMQILSRYRSVSI